MTASLFLLLTACFIGTAIAGGNKDRSDNDDNQNNRVMTAIAMSLSARYNEHNEDTQDEWPLIKCQNAVEGIKEAYFDTSGDPPLNVRAMEFATKIAIMYEKKLRRNPDEYYYEMRKAFPDICAVQSLGPGEFGLCFAHFIKYYNENYPPKRMANASGRKNMFANWKK